MFLCVLRRFVHRKNREKHVSYEPSHPFETPENRHVPRAWHAGRAMMGGALLALLGMGLLAAGMVMSGGEDDAAEALPPPQDDLIDLDDLDDTAPRVVSLLEQSAPLEAAPEGEVFAATEPRGADGHLPAISGFDPGTDLLAFYVTDLAAGCTTPQGDAMFADPDRVSYDLSIAAHPKLGGTVVTLSLFDASSSANGPVHFDVHLTDLEELDAGCVSVLAGDADLETAQGGERAGLPAEQGGPTAVVAADHDIETGGGDDVLRGTARDARISTGVGRDDVDLDAENTWLALEGGDDSARISGGTGSFVDGGAGDDRITVPLGTDVTGGSGADMIAVHVDTPPEAGLPLFLWNQPVEDARFSAHSTITLDDSLDTLTLTLAPEVGGHLHRVELTQESYGTGSSEVYTHRYTLVIWTPEGVTDIQDLVNGSGSAFNGSLAQDSPRGAPDYEAAATDPDAPRVILTVDHGTGFDSWQDPQTEDMTTGTAEGPFNVNLVVNREMTSVHDSEIY